MSFKLGKPDVSVTVSMCCVNFRKLAVFDTWSRLVVHVAMDNTVVIEEISECSCVATLRVLFFLVIIQYMFKCHFSIGTPGTQT